MCELLKSGKSAINLLVSGKHFAGYIEQIIFNEQREVKEVKGYLIPLLLKAVLRQTVLKLLKLTDVFGRVREQDFIYSLLAEINNPTQDEYEIYKSDLMEAFGIMKIYPKNEDDFFHSLCSINLINAYLSRQRQNKQLKEKENKLFRNIYYFKTYLSDVLTERIKSQNFTIPIYVDKNLIMVEIKGFQFNFHSIPLNETLTNFSNSVNNKVIAWSGKRLQPIAPLLLNYSRAARQKK